MTNLLKKAPAPPLRIQIGGGFLLLMALIYFFDTSGLLAAMLPPIIVHEMGHISALRLFGAFPTRLKADFTGFSLDYKGDLSHLQSALTALGGPILGLFFAIASANLGEHFKSEYLLLCGGLGFILNSFNLLPIWPLDGGRVFYHLLAKGTSSLRAVTISTAVGWVFNALLLGAGLLLALGGMGAAALLAGIWLVVLRCRSCK